MIKLKLFKVVDTIEKDVDRLKIWAYLDLSNSKNQVMFNEFSKSKDFNDVPYFFAIAKTYWTAQAVPWTLWMIEYRKISDK